MQGVVPDGEPCEYAGVTRYVRGFYDGAGFPGGSRPQGKLTQRIGYNPTVPGQPVVTEDFSYSGLNGRLSQKDVTVSGGVLPKVTQKWQYNGLGLLAHHHHPRPDGVPAFAVSMVYDAGLPTSEYVNGIPMVTGITYQASGAFKTYTTGVGTGNVTTTIAQDPSLIPRPLTIGTSGAFVNFSTGNFVYDGAGNIRRMGSDRCEYDPRSRVAGADLPQGAQSFSYDRYGNLLDVTGVGARSFCAGTCPSNRIPGATYDARGNLIAHGGQSYGYDALDRLTLHGTSGYGYVYDGGGERIARIPPAGDWTYTLRDDTQILSEYVGATLSRDNVFLGNMLVASYASGAVTGNGPLWTYDASDHLGSPRLITGLAGNSIESRGYWPFGEGATTHGLFQRVRFATMERDTEGSRYYAHARSHDFNLARFLTPDLLHGSVDNPQSWNRYSYVLNNPLVLVDPFGLKDCGAWSGGDRGGYQCGDIASANVKGAFYNPTTIPPIIWIPGNQGTPIRPPGGSGGGTGGGGDPGDPVSEFGPMGPPRPLRPCGSVDKFFKAAGKLVMALTVDAAGQIPSTPFGFAGFAKPNQDGSVDIYGGFGFARGLSAAGAAPGMNVIMGNDAPGVRNTGLGVRLSGTAGSGVGAGGSVYLGPRAIEYSAGARVAFGKSATLTVGPRFRIPPIKTLLSQLPECQ